MPLNVGYVINRETSEPGPIDSADLSVVGLIGPFTKAPRAAQTEFDARFPVDTPVYCTTTDATAALIDPDNEIGRAISMINAQVATGQQAARLVLVRVTAGADTDATIANIVGNAANFTGIHAFRRSAALVNVTPRLIAAPGFTSQTKNGVTSATITAQGTGGTNGTFALTFTGGTGSGAAGTFTVANNRVTDITITAGGTYTAAPTPTFTNSAGLTGATGTTSIGMLANPVVAALPAVLEALFAVAYVQGPADTDNNIKSYRGTIASRRIAVLAPQAIVTLSNGTNANSDLAPAALGLHVRRDFQFGGRPFRSILNQIVAGVVGPSRAIDFSLIDGASAGQDLLSLQIGVLVRGQPGDDFASADGGFALMAYENTGTDLIWRQVHTVRGRDFVELTVMRTIRQYFGRYNLTTQTIRDIVNTVDNVVQQAVGNGELLGGLVRFDPNKNNVSDLRSGKIYVEMKFETAPVFRQAEFASRPYALAVSKTIQELLDQA